VPRFEQTEKLTATPGPLKEAPGTQAFPGTASSRSFLNGGSRDGGPADRVDTPFAGRLSSTTSPAPIHAESSGLPVSDTLEQEIRHLRTLYWSDRDPEGRAFVPLADACVRAGRLDEAAELLEDGCSRHPDFLPGYIVSARLAEARGDLAAAEASLEAARELDPDNSQALFGLGRILAGRGEEAGVEMVERARALDPSVGRQIASLRPAPAPASADVASEVAEVASGADEPDPDVATPDSDPPVMSIEALAPDPDETLGEEPTLSITDLAPEGEDSDAIEPDEADEVMSLDDLAPAIEPDEVMSMDDLAPADEPDEVMSLDDVAPADEADEVMSLDDLAPADEADEMMSLDDLAPADEPDEIMSLDDVAPADEPDEIMSLDDLAPVDEPDEVMSLDDLAPSDEPDEIAPLESLTPDADPDPAGSVEPTEVEEPAAPDEDAGVVTRTLAELFVQQGLTDRAVEIYERLVAREPENHQLSTRLEELRAEVSGDDTPADEISAEEVEEVGQRLADAADEVEPHVPEAPHPHPEDPTPFGWAVTDEDPMDPVPEGASIAAYFGKLLAFTPGGPHSTAEVAATVEAPEAEGPEIDVQESGGDAVFDSWEDPQ